MPSQRVPLSCSAGSCVAAWTESARAMNRVHYRITPTRTKVLLLHDELKVASRLARAAGEAALAYYGRIPTEYEGTSPVTEADRASNRVIVAGLTAAFPGDAILSEESADTPARLA